MPEEYKPRNELYAEMQREGRLDTYELAYKEIKEAQDTVRKANPDNPLVNLITLSLYDGKPSFATLPRSIYILEEHAKVTNFDNLATILGHYVELLRSEIKNPRFPARV